jgi:hypothetical protein
MLNRVLDRKPSLIAIACSLLALLALTLLAGQSIAQAKQGSAKQSTCRSAAAATATHAKRCTPAAHHAKTKRKLHAKTKSSHVKKKAHARKVASVPPATCEDGSRPTPSNEEGYVCEDGSEPACPDGYELKTANTTGAPSCSAVVGSASEAASCEDGSEATESGTNFYTCDDGSEPSCVDGSEPEPSASGSTLVCSKPESNDAANPEGSDS